MDHKLLTLIIENGIQIIMTVKYMMKNPILFLHINENRRLGLQIFEVLHFCEKKRKLFLPTTNYIFVQKIVLSLLFDIDKSSKMIVK